MKRKRKIKLPPGLYSQHIDEPRMKILNDNPNRKLLYLDTCDIILAETLYGIDRDELVNQLHHMYEGVIPRIHIEHVIDWLYNMGLLIKSMGALTVPWASQQVVETRNRSDRYRANVEKRWNKTKSSGESGNKYKSEIQKESGEPQALHKSDAAEKALQKNGAVESAVEIPRDAVVKSEPAVENKSETAVEISPADFLSGALQKSDAPALQKITKHKAFNDTHQFIADNLSEHPELRDLLIEWIGIRKMKNAVITVQSMKRQLSKLHKLSNGDMGVARDVVQQSVDNGWTGLFEVKTQKTKDDAYERAAREIANQ